MPLVDDTFLWWLMVLTGCAAAGLSLYAAASARHGASDTRRYQLNIASYVMLSISILTFVARGLMSVQ